MSDTSGLPPAGWYPDPAGSGDQRWWDGISWTAHTQRPLPPLKPEPEQAWLERNEPMPPSVVQQPVQQPSEPSQPVQPVVQQQVQPSAQQPEQHQQQPWPTQPAWAAQSEPQHDAEWHAQVQHQAQPEVEPAQQPWPTDPTGPWQMQPATPWPTAAEQPVWQAGSAQPWQVGSAQAWQGEPAQQADSAQQAEWQQQQAVSAQPSWQTGPEAGMVWPLDPVDPVTSSPEDTANVTGAPETPAGRFPLDSAPENALAAAPPPAVAQQPVPQPAPTSDAFRDFLSQSDPGGGRAEQPLTRRDALASSARSHSRESGRPADSRRAINFPSWVGLVVALAAAALAFIPTVLPADVRTALFYGVCAVAFVLSTVGFLMGGRLNSGRWQGVAGMLISAGAALYAFAMVEALRLTF